MRGRGPSVDSYAHETVIRYSQGVRLIRVSTFEFALCYDTSIDAMSLGDNSLNRSCAVRACA